MRERIWKWEHIAILSHMWIRGVPKHWKKVKNNVLRKFSAVKDMRFWIKCPTDWPEQLVKTGEI